MLDHVGFAVSDIDRSRAFYETALAPIGLEVVGEVENTDAGGRAVLFGKPGEEAELVIADHEQPGEGNHIAFRVDSRAEVDSFYAAALEAGGIDNGRPGIRKAYAADYYAAFVLDPDGFNVEAVFHENG